MGFHICITNQNVIPQTLEKRIYGNVGERGESGQIVWGKIRDLYAVKPGDQILFYVKNPVSQFIGIFEVTTVPYICYDDIFGDETNVYPYRFNFKTRLNFPNPIPAYEFYSLVEMGKINSVLSLSRDVNSSYRGIRQLFESEFKEILQLFYKYNPKTNPHSFKEPPKSAFRIKKIEARAFAEKSIDAFNKPTEISFNQVPIKKNKVTFENVLHSYLVANILNDTNNVRTTLGLTNFNELILEAPVFKAMQFRSDILATFKHENKVYFYSFFELKKDKKIGINEISQLMGYLKSFAASKSLPTNSYEGVYISTKFDEELVDYLIKRQTVEKENVLSLIAYKADDDGYISLTKIL